MTMCTSRLEKLLKERKEAKEAEGKAAKSQPVSPPSRNARRRKAAAAKKEQEAAERKRAAAENAPMWAEDVLAAELATRESFPVDTERTAEDQAVGSTSSTKVKVFVPPQMEG